LICFLSDLAKFPSFNCPAFRNIENLLSVLAMAGLCMGLESVVESWVSKIELHSSKLRNISQERLNHKAMIANGPQVVHCDIVVREALSAYWAKSKNKKK
jgi:hypothetical protein